MRVRTIQLHNEVYKKLGLPDTEWLPDKVVSMQLIAHQPLTYTEGDDIKPFSFLRYAIAADGRYQPLEP